MKKTFPKTKKETQNKYNAIWLSHSSVSDFLKCPRLYYLRNVWKNKNGNKVNIVSPSLSLGSCVHQTIEPLALLKKEERENIFSNKELVNKFENNWLKYSGKKGGFLDKDTENIFKTEGLKMIHNILENPGPILKKTVKFYTGDFIPNMYLSESENIILCGLVDWVEYIESNDTLRVLDFKTGKNEEREDSFQLPIYKLLVEFSQKRKVSSGAYWYLAHDKFPKSVELIDEDILEIKEKLLEIGLDIKRRKTVGNIEENFKCKNGGCFACKDMELIFNNDKNVEYLGQGEYKQDLYLINK